MRNSTATVVARSDRTVTAVVDFVNPLTSTVMTYSPMGTERSENSPALSVDVARAKAEERELRVTLAAAIGRCWGSRTMPFTSPKTEARAEIKPNVMSATQHGILQRFITTP